MIVKKILSFAASIIKLFIFFSYFLNSNVFADNNKYYSNEKGIVSIMYHRFNESKYPSTNIQMNIFEEQVNIIKKSGYKFLNPNNFHKIYDKEKLEKTILLSVDDGYDSFYRYAWPYLKNNQIPFLIFISTEAIGKKGYMGWKEIKEIEKYDFVTIGNHSHSHDYLVNFSYDEFKKDIEKSIKIFQDNLGYNPKFFSYPFGEWDLAQKKFISKNFDFGFGQHSGVIDLNKDKYELPRFPINEKYGDLERFKFIVELLPLQYKKVYPQEKIIDNNNPPDMKVEFFKEQKINNINCYSNEGNGWDSSKLKLENNILKINFRDKFNTRRGRINCSMKDEIGWRWFGIQFIVKNIKEN
jgi:peptidoglycan/xylan/chitin deacetylase (PgdA/CDA1 family)